MILKLWIADLRQMRQRILPRCPESRCGPAGRLWQRVWHGHGGIRLHDTWHCSPQCLEMAVRRRFARMALEVVPPPPPRHRLPLGLLLLSRGQLTNPQLRAALEAQKKDGMPLGRCLQELGYVSERDVTAALGLQWACPVLPAHAAESGTCDHLLPIRLMEDFQMLPVRFVRATGMLYVAFSGPVDYTLLYALEQMLDCRTEACLLSHSAMEQALAHSTREKRSREFCFDGIRESGEMARITAGYALKLGAHEARVVACGAHIWVRLECGEGPASVLFRRRPAQPMPMLAAAHGASALP